MADIYYIITFTSEDDYHVYETVHRATYEHNVLRGMAFRDAAKAEREAQYLNNRRSAETWRDRIIKNYPQKSWVNY